MPDQQQKRRLKAEILGDVQGVGFRFFAERYARQLGLRGWVRNRADGAVEVEAEGDATALEQFLNRLREGPRAAQVDDVQVSWGAYKGDLGPFGVRG